MDKTGTLTEGKPSVTDIALISADSEEELLEVELKDEEKVDLLDYLEELEDEDDAPNSFEEQEEIIEEERTEAQLLADFIREIMHTPEEFNLHFAEIIDYYGTTYSDILDKKLSFTAGEMERVLKEFSLVHNEKKTLYNRISFLAGCLAAIIMI